MSEKRTIKIYLSSKCIPNPGLGAWAYVIIKDDVIFSKKSYLITNQTNTQMDLAGAILALESLIEKSIYVGYNIEVYSSSQYLVKGINEWLPNWKEQNYSSVKNHKYWRRLDRAIQKCSPTFIWTSWSARNKYSELASKECDRMYKERNDLMDSFK